MKAFSNLSNPQLMIILQALVRDRLRIEGELSLCDSGNALKDLRSPLENQHRIQQELIHAIELEFDSREKE